MYFNFICIYNIRFYFDTFIFNSHTNMNRYSSKGSNYTSASKRSSKAGVNEQSFGDRPENENGPFSGAGVLVDET